MSDTSRTQARPGPPGSACCLQHNSREQPLPRSVPANSASLDKGGSWDLPSFLPHTDSSKTQSHPRRSMDGSGGSAPGTPGRDGSPRRALQTAGTPSSRKRHFKKAKTEFNTAGQVQRLTSSTSSCSGIASSSTGNAGLQPLGPVQTSMGCFVLVGAVAPLQHVGRP